jgi:hypothetical protein
MDPKGHGELPAPVAKKLPPSTAAVMPTYGWRHSCQLPELASPQLMRHHRKNVATKSQGLRGAKHHKAPRDGHP